MKDTQSCCEKCYSTYTEHDYPAHTTHDACINQTCECHKGKEINDKNGKRKMSKY